MSISTGTTVDSRATVELLPPIKKLLPTGRPTLALAVGCTGKARFGVSGWEGSTSALAVGCTGRGQKVRVRVGLGNSYIVVYYTTQQVTYLNAQK